MVDSTNPRIMASNIQELNARMVSNDVEGNPSGSGFNTLLTKMKIDGKKYKLPNQVVANPTGEATGEIETLEIGGSIYSVGGGGGYTPNYSETEAGVGISLGGSPVYGRLIPPTVGYVETSGWGTFNGSLSLSDVETFTKAELFYVTSDTTPIKGTLPVMTRISSGQLQARAQFQQSFDTSKTYMYIEYTKVQSNS